MFHRHHFRFAIILGIFGGLLAVGVSLFWPLEYKAESEVLIISKSRYGVDPYTVVKSAERVGENLAQIMPTRDFYNKVAAQGIEFDKAKFETPSDRQNRTNWARAVSGKVLFGTGVLHISAYGETPDQALNLASATASALVSQGWEYVGGDVSMKLVNPPFVSRYPVRPNLVLNFLFGFFFCAGVGVLLRMRK